MKPHAYLLVCGDLAIATMLAKRGDYLIEMSTTGEAAIKKALAVLPVLTIMDLNLTDTILTATEAIRVLKAIAPNTPILALSNRFHFRDEALSVGADEFLAKPYRQGRLIEVIERLVKV